MKTAKIFWSLSSVLINITIGIYIYLQSKGPSILAERFKYINENWAVYGGHWKAEFLIMIMMTIGAIYFALHWKSMSWTIISMGQLIILLTYPLMLGGYQNTPFEIANMANQMATTTFIFGNLVFLLGLFHLYLYSEIFQSWLRYVALTLSGITSFAFLLMVIGFLTWGDAVIIAPLVNLLYLINAYYGWKVKLTEVYSHQ